MGPLPNLRINSSRGDPKKITGHETRRSNRPATKEVVEGPTEKVKTLGGVGDTPPHTTLKGEKAVGSGRDREKVEMMTGKGKKIEAENVSPSLALSWEQIQKNKNKRSQTVGSGRQKMALSTSLATVQEEKSLRGGVLRKNDGKRGGSPKET